MKNNLDAPLRPRPDDMADETSPPATPQETDVRTLLAGAREAILLLDGERYRLRITARQKLILTK